MTQDKQSFLFNSYITNIKYYFYKVRNWFFPSYNNMIEYKSTFYRENDFFYEPLLRIN